MRKLVTVLIVLAVAGGGGYYYYRSTQSKEKATVNQVTITQGTIVEEVQATGTLEALRTVQVGPQVSGTILSLEGVDFNSIVHRGQVVARLDPSLLQVQVDIQKANIERQETDIASQKVQLDNDRRVLARTKELADKGLVNQQQYEDADLQVKTRRRRSNRPRSSSCRRARTWRRPSSTSRTLKSSRRSTASSSTVASTSARRFSRA
jgi:HlyD family secretion protein